MKNTTFALGFRTWRIALCIGVAAVLTACGGGEGGGTPAATPNPRAWQTPVLLETEDTGEAREPYIAVNASGSAAAVWYQQVGTKTYVVMANHTTAGQWGAAQVIGPSNARLARIAIDDSGNAMAVWQQTVVANDGTDNFIWARRLNASTGQWGTPTMLEINGLRLDYPQIAMHHNGNAMVVWQSQGDITTEIHARHYNASTMEWGTTTPLSTSTRSDTVQAAQVAMDGNGNAMAAWSQTNEGGTVTGILTSRYSASTGLWSKPKPIDANGAGDANLPQLAMDASGNTAVVWLQYDGAVVNLWTNRLSASTGQWGTATLLELDNQDDVFNAQVAMDANGNAIAVWEQADGKLGHAFARRYSASSGQWGTVTPLEPDTQIETYLPQMAMHANGNATVVWGRIVDHIPEMRISHYNASTEQWSSAATVPTSPADVPVGNAQIAIDDSGSVWIVWLQAASHILNIWANVLK